jgi:hypothetical protein
MGKVLPFRRPSTGPKDPTECEVTIEARPGLVVFVVDEAEIAMSCGQAPELARNLIEASIDAEAAEPGGAQ